MLRNCRANRMYPLSSCLIPVADAGAKRAIVRDAHSSNKKYIWKTFDVDHKPSLHSRLFQIMKLGLHSLNLRRFRF